MGGKGFLGGVCNKNAILRRGFKEITKIWRSMKQKLFEFQNFINNSTSQIVSNVSHHLMILLQC